MPLVLASNVLPPLSEEDSGIGPDRCTRKNAIHRARTSLAHTPEAGPDGGLVAARRLKGWQQHVDTAT